MIKMLLVIAALAYIGGTATALYWFLNRCAKDDGDEEPEIDVPAPPVYPARTEIHVEYLTDSCRRCAKAVPSLAYPMLTCTETHHLVFTHDWCPRWSQAKGATERRAV